VGIKNILCWYFKYLFLIYFKTSKLVVISVLWRHSRGTTQKKSVENPNPLFLKA